MPERVGPRAHAAVTPAPDAAGAPGGDAPAPRPFSALDEAGRTEYWAALALRHCRGLGARSRARLLRAFGSAYAAVRAPGEWGRAGLNRRQAGELATGAWRAEAHKEWDGARALDAAILLWTDPAFPRLLRELSDAPALLYCRGDASLLRAPAIAVVGSRRAGPHALEVAAHMARRLAACGITVISGMAQGIDSVAHAAALNGVGRSIGVLGTGIDRIYPRSGGELFERMARRGLLVSEFAPGTPPLAGNFPIRNRIISGLALGVAVIEAASRSGSLITARMALEQNREVFAVPGPALDAQCAGCQELIRQGARPVFSVEDILRDLAEVLRPYSISEASLPPEEAAPQAPSPAPPLAGAARAAAETLGTADRKERLLAHLRENGAVHIDTLAQALEISVAELSALLVGLEILGRVRRLPGARYEATP
ncbi:DNA-processing protein DprA [uncultured Desulfovibrio sp.]|uniref:DNA-processing protein DprA n=1 Tax=uncultured Desulfovibrio sp. TaxID=167968 RepID=UPI00280458EA|nr:DNA-processing protein DprA [uncultured Desulfovibrio sp.]